MDNNNIIRVTKAQKLEVIKSLIPEDASYTFPGSDKKSPYLFNYAGIIDFLDEQITLLKKKNTSTGKKKLTKAQEINESYKSLILAYLRQNPTLIVTATDTMERILRPAHPDVLWTNQKAAALLNAMVDKTDKETGEIISYGVLNKTEAKGKHPATFQIKPDCIEDDSKED